MANTNKNVNPLRTKVEKLKSKIINGQQLTKAELGVMNDYYGPIANLIASEPEILNIFQDAFKKNQGLSSMGVKAFQNAVQNTQWYAKSNSSMRLYETMRNNPREQGNLSSLKENVRSAIQDVVVSVLGLSMNDANVAPKIDGIVDNLLNSHFNDWQNYVERYTKTAFANFKATDLGGQLYKNESDIRALMNSMGVPVDPTTMQNYTMGLLSGTTSLEKIDSDIRKNAASMWAPFADRINAGETVDNIIYPYKQMIASMLEIDPSSIDMTKDGNGIDPLLQKALFSATDSKSVMSLTDLRKAIKQDSRWQYTKNAESEYASLTTNLMRMFGAGV